ncbi:MAG: hypothetical protein E6Q90_07445 [Actinobacteria bacterium]|nr:MAG: hypothetical protein E6Q90_07445 [Actinomycetota bacterium]
MRVESDQADVAAALQRMAATIRAEGGFVADDFTVRVRDRQLSCAIADQPGEAGRLLVSYPTSLQVPMSVLAWADNPNAMELADPSAPAPRGRLGRPQRSLLEDWLEIINAVDRVAHVRASVPEHAIADPAVRHHLADAGYPALREPNTDEAVRQTVIAWHSSGAGTAPDGSQRWRLIPLKHLVNHHPDGADQVPVPGRTAVATSATSDAVETFENYGDLDALQLLTFFGYVDRSAPLVHSVPVEVESPAVGRVVVRWRAPRNPRAAEARDVPEIAPLDGEVGGLAIRHLTIRPDNRARVAAYLSMACQSIGGLEAPRARREGEGILDSILAANEAYYQGLDRLLAASADPFLPLVEVSLLQQQRLREMWGC